MPMTVLVVARDQAVIDRIVPLLRAGGIDARGTTRGDDAIVQLHARTIGALVIGGGIDAAERDRLRALAQTGGVAVIDGAARGKEPAQYVREELLPALRRVGAAKVD
jgi:hypothetical protein